MKRVFKNQSYHSAVIFHKPWGTCNYRFIAFSNEESGLHFLATYNFKLMKRAKGPYPKYKGRWLGPIVIAEFIKDVQSVKVDHV